VNVKLPPPQSVPEGGVIVNDGSGEIVIVYVSTDAQPPTVYSSEMVPVAPAPHVTVKEFAVLPGPLACEPETSVQEASTAVIVPPDTVTVCEPAPPVVV
jgi:hypothetical protein